MRRYVRGLALATGALAFSLAGWLLASAVQPQPAVNVAGWLLAPPVQSQPAVNVAGARSQGHRAVHRPRLSARDRGGRGQERMCPGHGQQADGGAAVACPVSVTTASLPDATLGTRYSVPVLAVSGGIPPYTWSVSDRWLPPPGLSSSPAGVISGSPVLAGAFGFTVQAADSAGATATASLSITVGGCATKITGSHNRPLTIGAGVTCLDQATISGPVTITAGAVVSIQASTLGGPLSADRPARLAVCGSTVSGPASATGAAGPVLLGGANGTPCPADTVTGLVTLTGDAGGVTLGGATISGPAHVAGNGGRVTVSGNTIGGPASITGNSGAHPGGGQLGQRGAVVLRQPPGPRRRRQAQHQQRPGHRPVLRPDLTPFASPSSTGCAGVPSRPGSARPPSWSARSRPPRLVAPRDRRGGADTRDRASGRMADDGRFPLPCAASART